VYVGAHLPLDVVGGWALGVAAACIVHLIFGVPDRNWIEERANATESPVPVAEDDRERSEAEV
jgi:undecaprenyl-diphosphatase